MALTYILIQRNKLEKKILDNGEQLNTIHLIFKFFKFSDVLPVFHSCINIKSPYLSDTRIKC